jgi:hypothetical protein
MRYYKSSKENIYFGEAIIMNEFNSKSSNNIEEILSEKISLNLVDASCSAEFSEGCIFFEK